MPANTKPESQDQDRATRCPLCEQDNRCAVAAGESGEHCWCQAGVSKDSLAQAQALGETDRCICPRCGQ